MKILKIAKWLYMQIPFQPLRQLLFTAFCFLVRRQKLTTEINGIRYALDLGEMIDVCLLLGRYEPSLSESIQKFCQKGNIVLDIGANIGAHALRMAKIVGASGKVYAFEPTDYAYNKLVKNISLNEFENIKPIKVALAEQNVENAEIDFKSSWPTFGKPENIKSYVSFERLDDWISENQVGKVDLIKLDVDGNEFSVLSGAKKCLEVQGPIILMEVWGINFKNPDRNPFAFLRDAGYRFFDMTNQEELSLKDMEARVTKDNQWLDFSFDIIARKS